MILRQPSPAGGAGQPRRPGQNRNQSWNYNHPWGGGPPPSYRPPDSTHTRNTQNNKNKSSSGGGGYSNPGGMAALPALSPASTANFYNQLSGYAAQYQLKVAALREQRVGLKAGFRATRAEDIRQRQLGLGQAESQALDTGMLGSSIDANRRAGVRADAASAIAAARNEMLQGVAQTRIEQQGAGIEFFQEKTALQAQALAEQQSALAQQLQQNQIYSGKEGNLNILKRFYQNFPQGG